METSSGGAARDEVTGDRPETAPSEWPRWYVLAWVVAAILVSVALGWVHFAVGGPRVARVFTDVAVATGATAAALAVTWLARSPGTAMRRGWTLLAVGFWSEAVAETLWAGYTLVAGAAPYPGLPDLFYLAGYPFIAAGLLALAVDRRDSRPRVRFALDGLVVATALLVFGWHFALQPLLATSSVGALETWVSLGYPIADIAVASIALVVGMHARGPRRTTILLIAAGLFAWAIGDIGFAAMEFAGGYTFDTLGLLWLGGDLTIALAALHPDAGAPAVPIDRRQFSFPELVFPFGPFLMALALLTGLGVVGALDPGDVVVVALAGVFVVARQVHVSAESTRLGRELDESERLLGQRNEQLLLVNRIVRHDIRNDMNVAHGWAEELAGRVAGDEEAREMLDRILRTTRHTIDLTKVLRDFVEAMEGDESTATEPVSLRSHLVGSVRSRRETYPEATFDVGDVPDVDVEANALLDTVFRNVLNNAVQHNDTDEPRVDVTTEVADGVARVRIADNGPGVPGEAKETVFGRGEKGLDSPGSGVGLYLVDTLVGQYGGDVWIEDEEPRGAAVVVELTLAE